MSHDKRTNGLWPAIDRFIVVAPLTEFIEKKICVPDGTHTGKIKGNNCVGQECKLEMSGKFQGKIILLSDVLGSHAMQHVKQQTDRNIRQHKGINIYEIPSVSNCLATNSRQTSCVLMSMR